MAWAARLMARALAVVILLRKSNAALILWIAPRFMNLWIPEYEPLMVCSPLAVDNALASLRALGLVKASY